MPYRLICVGVPVRVSNNAVSLTRKSLATSYSALLFGGKALGYYAKYRMHGVEPRKSFYRELQRCSVAIPDPVIPAFAGMT